jgi:hypothetical protein
MTAPISRASVNYTLFIGITHPCRWLLSFTKQHHMLRASDQLSLVMVRVRVGVKRLDIAITNTVYLPSSRLFTISRLRTHRVPVPCFPTALQHVNIQQKVDSTCSISIFRVLVGSMTHSLWHVACSTCFVWSVASSTFDHQRLG